MTDLSQRIMQAWLKRNPEPDKWETEMPYEKKIEWRHNKRYLQSQLDCEAYESAVIQFLVPEGVTYEIGNYLFNEATLQVGDETISSCSKASSVAEALLNAIEAIDDTK